MPTGTEWFSTQMNTLLLAPRNIVRVNATGAGGAQASPYNANPWDFVIVDTSVGNVVVNLPTLSGLGTEVTVKHDDATSLVTNSFTVNGPTSPAVLLAEPSPNNGSFAASVQFPPAGTPSQNRPLYAGTELSWFNGGSSGGYLLT